MFSVTAAEPRRSLTASGSLILIDVSFGDTAIYQCQASNKHGTILTNTNVYVIGEYLFSICSLVKCLRERLRLISLSCCVTELPPQILTENGTTYTFVEGQKAVLDCKTFGSPKPKVTWWDLVPSNSVTLHPVTLQPVSLYICWQAHFLMRCALRRWHFISIN